MTARLTQAQAADLADVTPRRMRQLDHESDPPPRFGDGYYPAAAFGAWLNRRAIGKNPAFLRGWDLGREGGLASMGWRVVDEMRVLAGAEGAAAADLWPEDRQAPVAELRARIAALPNAAEVEAILAAYADGLLSTDW